MKVTVVSTGAPSQAALAAVGGVLLAVLARVNEKAAHAADSKEAA